MWWFIPFIPGLPRGRGRRRQPHTGTCQRPAPGARGKSTITLLLISSFFFIFPLIYSRKQTTELFCLLYLLYTKVTLVNLLFRIYSLTGCFPCRCNPQYPKPPTEILELSYTRTHTRVPPWCPAMHPTPLNTEAVGPAESPLPSHTITCSLPRRSAQDWGGGESRTVIPVKSGEPQEAQSTPRTAPRREGGTKKLASNSQAQRKLI